MHLEEFVDGAMGANNPVYSLWTEAQDIWSSKNLERNIECLISIGTGVPSLTPFGGNPIEIYSTLKDMVIETEKTAERFNRDKRELGDRYYRFNVANGLENVGLEETQRRDTVSAATRRYLESQDVFRVVQTLKNHSKIAAVSDASRYAREGHRAYDAKEYTEAVELFRKSLEGLDDYDEISTDESADIHRYYAQSLYMSKQPQQSRAEFDKLVSWATQKFGPDHPETLKRRVSLGLALKGCKLLMEASTEFQIAALGFERASKERDSLQCRYQLGTVLSDHEAYDRSWPHWAEAESNLHRAFLGLSRLSSPPAEPTELFAAQVAYAQVLLKMCREVDSHRQFIAARRMAQRLGLWDEESEDVMVVTVRKGLAECEYWMGQPRRVKDGDWRRHRRNREERERDWRERTGHW
jgi:tetratricopeptide (TPR) repeat protein